MDRKELCNEESADTGWNGTGKLGVVLHNDAQQYLALWVIKQSPGVLGLGRGSGDTRYCVQFSRVELADGSRSTLHRVIFYFRFCRI